MPLKTKVSEVMRPLSEFPQIPYWYTVREAVFMLKAAGIDRTRHFDPVVVLVLDEQYRLVGHLRLRDLLRGLVPPGSEGQPEPWRVVFTREGRQAAERPVSEFMVPLATALAPEEPVAKAAWAMAKEEVNVIPVVEAGRPLGIVRLRDIFDAVVEASLVQHGGAVEASG